MTTGILGSGFGLYGYLPALLGLGETVVLPARYRATLLARDDLRHLDGRTEWVAGEAEVLARADALIVSRRPADQMEAVRRALAVPTVTRLLLEKPLAPEPVAAAAMLEALAKAGRSVRIGFTFRAAPWAARVTEWVAGASPDATLDFDWGFHAHHYATGLDTWKRRVGEGGGALRFYGIQLIGLLAEWGYDDALESRVAGEGPDDAARWTATFTGPGLPRCRVLVDSRAGEPRFAATAPGLALHLRDPFEEAPTEPGQDRRVALLAKLCRSLLRDVSGTPDWYARSVVLWQAAEHRASRA